MRLGREKEGGVCLERECKGWGAALDGRQAGRQADRQTDRQTDRQQTGRQTGRQADRKTGRQAGRQAGAATMPWHATSTHRCMTVAGVQKLSSAVMAIEKPNLRA